MGEDQPAFHPLCLILGPGGSRGFLEIGALLYLDQTRTISSVQSVVGVSVGAIIGSLLCARFSIEEILVEACQLNLFNDLSSVNFKELSSQSGLISSESVAKRLRDLFSAKLGLVPTLEQLHLITGMSFTTVATNITTHECTLFSRESHPTMSVVDAVVMSMNIPLLFYRYELNGNTYIDGAFANPYPANIFDDGQTDILGMYISTDHVNGNSLPAYLYNIITTIITIRKKEIQSACSSRVKTLDLTTNIVDTTGISLTLEQKVTMVISGYRQAQDWLKNILV